MARYVTTKRGSRSYTKQRRTPARRLKRKVRRRTSTKRRSTGMSKRRLLNITSRKKRDTLLTTTSSNSDGTTGATVKLTGTTVNGQDGAFFVFCPTARDLTTVAGNIGAVSQAASRTATSCYMRGFSEHLRIQTNSQAPWFHRRICFAARGSVFLGPSTGTGITPYRAYYDDAARGMTRHFLNSANNNTATFLDLMKSVLFKGTYNQDWNDLITAPVDNTRVDLKSDKTYLYRSGNAVGIVKEHKLWYPMNKTLVYDDDENGDTEVSVYNSVTDKRGMGDYFIVDIIQSGENGGVSDLMRINATSSLYWHER
nr:MAG: capsid protein [Gemykolovirus]